MASSKPITTANQVQAAFSQVDGLIRRQKFLSQQALRIRRPSGLSDLDWMFLQSGIGGQRGALAALYLKMSEFGVRDSPLKTECLVAFVTAYLESANRETRPDLLAGGMYVCNRYLATFRKKFRVCCVFTT